jgi:purine nucleosidase
VRPHGALGQRLAESIDRIVEMAATAGINMVETYGMGDQPMFEDFFAKLEQRAQSTA